MKKPLNTPMPTATIRPARRASLFWLIPAVGFIAGAILAYNSIFPEGIPITIQFAHGHGIKINDDIRHRGIRIGRITGVCLTPDGQAVEIKALLVPSAKGMAREGSRFWIARPQVGVGGVSGLDTVIGANYVNVRPGNGPFKDHFKGLEDQPHPSVIAPNSLTVVVSAPEKGRLHPGAPICYRELTIGVVSRVGLSRDAGSVTAAIYIAPDYVQLIRSQTRFWRSAGPRIRAGFAGFDVRLDSIQELIAGGINISVPPNPGPLASPGQTFTLYDRPDSDWLEWQPALNLTSHVENDQLPIPVQVKATFETRFLGWDREIDLVGWVLPVADGLLGPADILSPGKKSKAVQLRFLQDDQIIDPSGQPEPRGHGVIHLPCQHPYTVWPASKLRQVTKPENAVVVKDNKTPSRFLSADRWADNNGLMTVDPNFPFGDDWIGAPVVSDLDGAVIGFLLKDDDRVFIGLVQL